MPRIQTAVVRLADSVAAELERRILDGSVKPGDSLPSERKLAEDFGVSRPSVREALQKLVAKGLLSTRHGGGTIVTDRLEAPFVDPWEGLVKDHPMIHRDLLEFRQMLESQAAELAAERATPEHMEKIEKLYTEMQDAFSARDIDRCIEADVAFHQAIAEASHNVLIGHLTASLMRLLEGHVAKNLRHLHGRPAQWSQLCTQHEAIWQSVREGNAQQARQTAMEHMQFVRKSIENTAQIGARQAH